MSRTFRQYMTFVLGAARSRVVWTIFFIVLFSLTEGFGIALLLPILQVAGLDMGSQGALSHYAEMMVRPLEAAGMQPSLLPLLTLFLLLTGVRTFLNSVRSMAIFAVEQQLVCVLRERLYGAVANANWLFLCRSRSTDFAHALTEQIERVGSATYLLLMLAADVVVGALYVAMGIALSWQATVLMLACGALLVFLLRGRVSALHASGAEFSVAMRSFYAGTLEHLQSLKTAKTYGAQERNAALFAAFSRHASAVYLTISRQRAFAGAWFEAGSVVILCAILYVAIALLGMNSAAILILFLLFSRLMPHFMSSHQQFRDFVGMLPAFATVRELIDRCDAAAEAQAAPGRRHALRRTLELQRVSFSYRSEGKRVVRDLSLVIPAGKIVAIVGPSGAGKSTIVDLIMGLLLPDSGHILIDGETLESSDAQSWRKHIGYVAQETTLFHFSVRENLMWARPDATEPELIETLRLAAADEFTRALPDGIDTVIGEQGRLVSQGERQRLALARALLRRPSLLILDEATNSLDSENELRVLNAIEQLRGGMTVLIIAHRLSSIRNADLIYVVEDGTVVEAGGWRDLNGRPQGLFRALCEAQRLVA
jgi:ATP-binding cassette subfamily C protein